MHLVDTHLQWPSTRRLKAIFSRISTQTGVCKLIFARSPFTAITRPPVDKDPMFNIKLSPLASFFTYEYKKMAENLNLNREEQLTFAACLSPSVRTPNSLLNKK